MALIDTARQLADGAEKARMAGDTVASLALAIKAAELLQLAKLLDDEPPAPIFDGDEASKAEVGCACDIRHPAQPAPTTGDDHAE